MNMRRSSSSNGLRAGRRSPATIAGVVGLVLVLPVELAAHRVDEYLQATRIEMSLGRVKLEIDLTPGVEVAPSVLGAIDTDRDEQISPTEARAYASEVVRQMALLHDGVAQRLTLERSEFPSVAELNAGTGTIRLEASALTTDLRGRHRLSLKNWHRSDVGVYLVNVLVPATSQIVLDDHRRDPMQRGLELDYSLSSGLGRLVDPATVPLGMLALTGLALVARRRTTKTDQL